LVARFPSFGAKVHGKSASINWDRGMGFLKKRETAADRLVKETPPKMETKKITGDDVVGDQRIKDRGGFLVQDLPGFRVDDWGNEG